MWVWKLGQGREVFRKLKQAIRQGIHSANSIHAINLLTSGLFIVNDIICPLVVMIMWFACLPSESYLYLKTRGKNEFPGCVITCHAWPLAFKHAFLWRWFRQSQPSLLHRILMCGDQSIPLYLYTSCMETSQHVWRLGNICQMFGVLNLWQMCVKQPNVWVLKHFFQMLVTFDKI